MSARVAARAGPRIGYGVFRIADNAVTGDFIWSCQLELVASACGLDFFRA